MTATVGAVLEIHGPANEAGTAPIDVETFASPDLHTRESPCIDRGFLLLQWSD